MPRNARSLTEPANTMSDVELMPRLLQKKEFGRRLYALMREKGWTQSDLARAAFGTRINKQGRTIPDKKESVSQYLAGRQLPTPKALAALCDALGVTEDQLLPNQTINAIAREEPPLSIMASANDPNKIWIKVNRLVTAKQALRIQQVLLGDE